MAKTINRHAGRSRKVGIGAGVVALAAAAAAAYYFYGKNGAKNRAKAQRWAVAAKKDVLVRLRRLKSVNQKNYNQVVTAVAKKYGALQAVGPKEAQVLARELKSHWRNVSRALKKETARRK